MKVYLSSTYTDLVEYRERAYRTMRGLGLNVRAMEDYSARDDRPVDACLADVEASDLYVGLFGFRYGYIPPDDNPDGCSITELEYRKAVTLGIPRLIFLAEQDKWPMSKSDAVAHEGNNGALIDKLRAELQQERLVSMFGSPEQLESKLTRSAATWLLEQNAPPPPPPPAPDVIPSRRKVRYDLLLLHAPVDAERAAALAKSVAGVWPVETSGTGLTATGAEDLRALDQAACAARSAGVLLSPAALTMLAEDRGRSARALGLVRERTGILFGIPAEEVPQEDTAAWGFTEVLPLAAGAGAAGPGSTLHSALLRRVSRPADPELGLPVVVVAMTDAEAAELVTAPPAPLAGLIGQRPEDWWLGRYGSSRREWRPFDGPESVDEVLGHTVASLNERLDRLRGWTIRPRPYSFDALVRDGLAMWPVYEDIAKHGCLVIVDEISLFHAAVKDAFVGSPLYQGRQVALVSLSPLDPMHGTPQELIKDALDGYLTATADRFGVRLDPLCEMGVTQALRLDRWLGMSLPWAAHGLHQAASDAGRLHAFGSELGMTPSRAMARLVGGEVPR